MSQKPVAKQEVFVEPQRNTEFAYGILDRIAPEDGDLDVIFETLQVRLALAISQLEYRKSVFESLTLEDYDRNLLLDEINLALANLKSFGILTDQNSDPEDKKLRLVRSKAKPLGSELDDLQSDDQTRVLDEIVSIYLHHQVIIDSNAQ